MVMTPQTQDSETDPACGIGVLEWKVNGAKAADITDLKAAIKEAEEKNESDYTADSWKALEEALKAAKEAAGNASLTQEEADTAKAALVKAINGLVKKDEQPEEADKTALDAAIKEAEGKEEKDYTPSTWETFARVLNQQNLFRRMKRQHRKMLTMQQHS